MLELCEGLFVEFTTSDDVHRVVVGAYERAVARDVAFYGPLHAARPRVVFCETDPCRSYFAGTAMRSWHLWPWQHTRGGHYTSDGRHTIVIVRVDAVSENVLTHEVSHMEVARRIGEAWVPAWFDEGLATYLGDEPPCEGVSEPGIENLRDLEYGERWADYTDDPARQDLTYCQARAEVSRWVDRHGRPAVLALLDRVRHGESFDSVYGH